MNAANGTCPSPPTAAYLHHDNIMFPTPTTATTTVTATAATSTTAAASIAPIALGQLPRQQQQQWMLRPPRHPRQLKKTPSPTPRQDQTHQQQHHQQLYPPQPFAVASAAAAGGSTLPIDATVKNPHLSQPHSSVDMMMRFEEDYHLHSGERPPRRKRPKSMAFAYLQGHLLGDQSGGAASSCPEILRDLMTEPARNILQDLLDQHHLRLQESPDDMVTALAYVAQRFLPKKTVNKSMSIDQTLEWAKMDQLSFLGSFLMVMEEAESEAVSTAAQPHLQDGAAVVETTTTTTTTTAAVSALDLIKRCCLAINPSKIPPLMDAEEMAIAALEFLGSSTITDNNSSHGSNGNSNTLFPDLPLIRFVKYESDVRKRSYEKVGTWQLNDSMMQKVAALEEVFLLDCTDYRFLRRGVCGPRMTSSAAEDALYLRGKHKVTTSSSSNSSSATSKKNSNASASRAAAALRMAAAMKTAADSASSAVLVGEENANNDHAVHHPTDVAEHQLSHHMAQGALTNTIFALDDDGGEADDGGNGEVNSHSHSPAYPESYE